MPEETTYQTGYETKIEILSPMFRKDLVWRGTTELLAQKAHHSWVEHPDLPSPSISWDVHLLFHDPSDASYLHKMKIK